jgi:hypothetical protein
MPPVECKTDVPFRPQAAQLFFLIPLARSANLLAIQKKFKMNKNHVDNHPQRDVKTSKFYNQAHLVK